MNERMRNRLLVLAIVLAIVVWLGPRALSLAFLAQGGRYISTEALSALGIAAGTIPCSVDPVDTPEAHAQFEAAITALAKAARFNPQSAQANLQLGHAYCWNGQPDKAIEAYRGFVKLRPNSPLGHLGLGFAYELVGKTDLAANEWMSADIFGHDFMDNGHASLKERDYSAALRWYRRAGYLNAPEAPAFTAYAQGLVYQAEGAIDQAFAAFRQAIDFDSQTYRLTSSALFRIGLLQQVQLGDWADAQESLTKAIIAGSFISPQDQAETHYRLGMILKQFGQLDQAMQEFQNAVDNYSYHYAALMELGIGHWQIYRNFPLAEKTLMRAIKASPTGKWAYTLLGNVYVEVDQFEKSLEMYATASSLDPEDQQLIQLIATVKQKIAERGR